MTLIDTQTADAGADAAPRTYEVRTFGCQMNVHDSERLSGSLEAAGYVRAVEGDADVVVINTCAVRENADNKLYGTLGHLASTKREHEGMQIAVGGCLAQKDKSSHPRARPLGRRRLRHPQHGVASRPPRARPPQRRGPARDPRVARGLPVDPADPARVDLQRLGLHLGRLQQHLHLLHRAVAARQGEGPPARRDPRRDRGARRDGAIEVTLLGQNVNSYGVEFGDRLAFGKLLRAAGQIEGLERIRFTSPHPAAFTDDVIDAMAETPTVMPQLHMPLQSGSDSILRAMRRSYRSERFLGILDRVRDRIPNAAISTDIIVGFPGETEEDFQDTLRIVEKARFASAYTFQYSIRPGTPAATLPDQLPKAVVQERFERLIALQERISAEENEALVGRSVEVLVAGGEGKRDKETHRMSGRAEDSRLVHFDVPDGGTIPRPGDVVSVVVTRATPHFLIAAPAGDTLPVRRTRAGDAWDRAEAESCAVPAPASTGSRAVNIGLPSFRAS